MKNLLSFWYDSWRELCYKDVWKTALHEKGEKMERNQEKRKMQRKKRDVVFEKIRASLNNYTEPYSLSPCVGEVPED